MMLLIGPELAPWHEMPDLVYPQIIQEWGPNDEEKRFQNKLGSSGWTTLPAS